MQIETDHSRHVSSPAAGELQPLAQHERIAVLDLLRGVALLGIFVVNMQLFAMPLREFTVPYGLPSDSTGSIAAWAIVKTFFEYKFISLFSLLFGAGAAMQWMRARQRGRPFAPMFLRRLAVLAVIGLLHGLLLWYGDVLFVYACLGVIVMLCIGLRPRTMFIIAPALIALMALLYGALAVVVVMVGDASAEPVTSVTAHDETPSDSPEVSASSGETPFGKPDQTPAADSHDPTPAPSAANEPASATPSQQEKARPLYLQRMIDSGFDINSEKWAEAETDTFKSGPFLAALMFRAVLYAASLVSSILGYGWHALAMMFIGAGMMKLSFFGSSFSRQHRRLAMLGLGIGLPLELLSTFLNWRGLVTQDYAMTILATVPHEIGSAIMCLGLVGLGCLAASLPGLHRFLAPVRAVGQMALSNYLLETIIATTLMYWWGFGWFGEVSRPRQIGLALLIYMGLILGSTVWMGLFRMGPMEWLWRTVTYWRVQPMRRLSAPSVHEDSSCGR